MVALDAGSVEATLRIDLDDAGFREGDRKMDEWARKKSTATLDADTNDRAFALAETKLRAWGSQSATAELKFDVDRSSLARLIAGASAGGKGIDNFTSSVEAGGAGLARFGQTMQGLQWAGILTGAPAAAAALVNLTGASVAVGSALSSLSGLLVALPQGLLGFAQAGGTVALATHGIGDALKAYTQQTQNATKVSEQAATRETSAAAQRRAAAQSIQSAQNGVEDANRDVEDSEDDLALAHERVTIAQQEMNEAIEQAKRDMQDLQRAVPEAATAEKQAHLNLLEARRALDKGLRDPRTGGLELRQLRLNITEAEQAYKDAQISTQRAREDSNQAEREGVRGMPQVVAARQAIADAERQVADAAERVADAHRQASRAAENLGYQQEQARLQLEQTRESMQASTTTANVYQQALENLTPAQRRFTRFLVDLKDRLDVLRSTAARNFLPGLTRGIESAMKNFPTLRRIIGDTGKVLGNVSERIGRFFGSKQFGRQMEVFARTNLRLFERLGGAAIGFTRGLNQVMMAAQPLVRWLGRLFETLGRGFDEWATNARKSGQLAAFFEETRKTTTQVLRLFRNLFDVLAGLGEAAAPAGNKIIGFFNRMLRKWAEFTHSFEGHLFLTEFFEGMVRPFEKMMRLLGEFAGMLFDVFGGEEGQKMLEELTDALRDMLPPLGRLLEAFVEMVTIAGPSLIDAFASMFAIFADGAPAMALAAKAMAAFANAVMWAYKNIPFFGPVAGDITNFAIAMAGVRWIYINSGIKAMGSAMYNVFKKGGIIEAAPARVSAFMDSLVAFPGALKNRASRIVASVKEVFLRIGSRLGLITGGEAAAGTVGGETAGGLIGGIRSRLGRMRAKLGAIFRTIGGWLGLRMGAEVAVGTAGGEAAGAAGGGLIGRMRGLMGRLRSRLGRMFAALGLYLGIQVGERAAAGTVGGEAAGAAGGGIIGGLNKRMPRLKGYMRGIGRTLGTAFMLGFAIFAGAKLLEAFDKYVRPELNEWLDRNVPGYSKLHGEEAFGSFKGPGGVGTSPVPVGTGPAYTSLQDAIEAAVGRRFGNLGGGRAVHAINVLSRKLGPTFETLQAEPTSAAMRRLRRLLRGFQGGGVVGSTSRPPGPTDSVLAALTPGEIVLPRKASQAIQNAVGPITQNTEKVTKALVKLIRRDVHDAFVGLLGDVGDVEDRLLKITRDRFSDMHVSARKDADGLHDDAKDSITDLADVWERSTDQMADQTQRRFAQMADTARRRSGELAGYVKDAMREATGTMYDGVSYIASTVEKGLKAFDAKTKFHLSIEKPNLEGHAQGGMIGGEGRKDTVPLLLGMAAPGEAILTRHQQRWVEAALHNTFGMGLGDLFRRESRPHGYERGGMLRDVPGYQKGGGLSFGPVPGFPGEEANTRILPALTGFLRKYNLWLSDAYDRDGSGGHSSSEHNVYGTAADVGPNDGDWGKFARTALTYAVGQGWNPVYYDGSYGTVAAANHGPGNHAHVTFLTAAEFLAGKSVAGGRAAVAEMVKMLKLGGTKGPMMDLVGGALNRVRGGANDFLSRMSAKFATDTGGPGLGPNVALGPIRGMAQDMVLKEWGAGEWPEFDWLEMHEAGYDPHADNPYSDAFGIAQNINPSTYPPAGRPGSSAPILEQARAQLRWMIGYIRDRYGRPSVAKAGYFGGNLGGPSGYQHGGFIGHALNRLRKLTKLPAIHHLQERLQGIQGKIRRGSHRLEHLSRDQLHGAAGKRLRDAIKAQQRLSHQISEKIHDVNASVHGHRDRIEAIRGRLAPHLIRAFDRAERIAGGGASATNLLERLHVGRPGGVLHGFARSRASEVRNAMAISRAQAPVLAQRSIFAGGGYVGAPIGGSNVAAAPPVYLMFDADVDAFVGRVRAVQNGREVEIARGAGLARLTPGSIGRKAVYS